MIYVILFLVLLVMCYHWQPFPPKRGNLAFWPSIYLTHCKTQLGITDKKLALVSRLLCAVPCGEVTRPPNYINTSFDEGTVLIEWNFGHNVLLEVHLDERQPNKLKYIFEGGGETKTNEVHFDTKFPPELLRIYHYAENVFDDLN